MKQHPYYEQPQYAGLQGYVYKEDQQRNGSHQRKQGTCTKNGGHSIGCPFVATDQKINIVIINHNRNVEGSRGDTHSEEINQVYDQIPQHEKYEGIDRNDIEGVPGILNQTPVLGCL